ncbi:MAG: hypothetical protein WDW38_003490 [Sanguina aurantia]
MSAAAPADADAVPVDRIFTPRGCEDEARVRTTAFLERDTARAGSPRKFEKQASLTSRTPCDAWAGEMSPPKLEKQGPPDEQVAPWWNPNRHGGQACL